MSEIYDAISPDGNEALRACQTGVDCLGRGVCHLIRLQDAISETAEETTREFRPTVIREVEILRDLVKGVSECGFNILIAQESPDLQD